MESISYVFFLLLLLICTCTISIFLVSRRKPSHPNLPPGPSPLPIIGNLLELGKKPHQSMAKLATIHGPVMMLKLGQVTTIVISSSQMAKEVLQTHDQFFSNRPIPQSIQVVNHHHYSLAFLPVSPLWRNLRKICNNELFAQKTLDASKDLRHKIVQQLFNDIHHSSENAEAIDIGTLVFKTTINLLSNTILSMDMVDSTSTTCEFKDVVTDITKLNGVPNLADYFPQLKMFDPQRIHEHNAAHHQKLLNIFDRLINQRLMLRATTAGYEDHTNKKDMLTALLNIADDQQNNKLINKTVIQHLLLELFVAGTETSTSTLEWAMAELLRNPKVMSKAKQELEQSIGKRKVVEESEIGRVPYLQAIMKETLRLHPAAPLLLPRKAEIDVNIRGYTIPKDAQMLINVWRIGRDPNEWDNPDLFLPERFLNSQIDAKGQHFELTPFWCWTKNMSWRVFGYEDVAFDVRHFG